jgi:hypothetical protein
MQAQKKYPIKIGEDRILRKENRLIICSKVDRKEWQVQTVRKTVICVDDELWQLSEKQQRMHKEIRYYLDPWLNAQKEIPGRIIRYDEAYVKACDEAEKKRKIAFAIGAILHIFRPLIGFFPSRIKTRIEANYGIPSRSITFVSIIIELLAFFVMGAFLQIFTYGAMHAPQLVVFIPFFLVMPPILLIDVIVRYHSYFREDASPWGFYEWLIPKRKKR